ncbi:MAG: phosphoglycolate phosphatase [Thermoprotei archaeon]|nr:MAG: phosphoglycolate phosphatase [Thermoprotei archaeon]
MVKYKLLAVDIDGTITIDRNTYKLDLNVVSYMRLLEKHGIMVVLLSSNALPVVAGLKRYFGLKGPAVGETGALIYFGNDEVVRLSKYSAKEALKYVLEKYGDYLKESWQNPFRLHDFALKLKKPIGDVKGFISKVKADVEKRYPYIRVSYSGFAVHLTPIDVSKAKALELIIERYGLSTDEVVAIGDSVMDIDYVSMAGLGVAVSNADEELKAVAKYVTKNPSSSGFIELAEMLLENKI